MQMSYVVFLELQKPSKQKTNKPIHGSTLNGIVNNEMEASSQNPPKIVKKIIKWSVNFMSQQECLNNFR